MNTDSYMYPCIMENVFQTDNGWARICKTCGRQVEYTGDNARIMALNTREYECCKLCRKMPRVEMKPIGEGEQEKDYFLDISDGRTKNELGGATIRQVPFKRCNVICSNCGQPRWQNVPVEWSHFSYFCHKCRMRNIINPQSLPVGG